MLNSDQLDGVAAAGRQVSVLTRVCGLIRDLLIAAVGWLTLTSPPASIAMLDTSHDSTTAWSLMLLGGGLVAAVGLVSKRLVVEAAGCGCAASGFAVWAYAAISQDDPTQVTVAAALVFIAGTVGQVQQTVTAAAGAFTAGQQSRR